MISSCGNDDDELHSNHIVGKWHIARSNLSKLIFNSDNTGVWIHGSEKNEFTWRADEASNAISIKQKFAGNNQSDWYMYFSKEECTPDILNGFYDTGTNNVGYIDNKSNYNIKLYRHTNNCQYVDYSGPSDWDEYIGNGNSGNEGTGGNGGNESGGNHGGGSSSYEEPDISFYDVTPGKNSLEVSYRIWNKDKCGSLSNARIYYGTYSANKRVNATISGVYIKAKITGLSKGTEYQVKCSVTGSGGSATTEESTLSTLY